MNWAAVFAAPYLVGLIILGLVIGRYMHWGDELRRSVVEQRRVNPSDGSRPSAPRLSITRDPK